MSADPDKRLSIYLNDHLAGATAGVELARRLRASNREEPEFGEPLAEICAEIETDRASLEAAMERMKVERSRVKPAVGWAGEKLGRLKPNGQVRGYSPLSRLVELEMLLLGITGKLRMWKALERTRGESGVNFGRLAERAEEQRARVEELQLLAAELAYPPTGAPATAKVG
jgi:hypothetical protein